jgi:5-methylcytosine-specific restriction endonuclease McrA
MSDRPRWTADTIKTVFEKRRGKCNICHGPLTREAYGIHDDPGGWHIDHSRALARGGHATHLNNLEPAHVACNLRKGTRSARAARTEHGKKRAPYTPREAARVRSGRAMISGGSAVLGLAAIGATGPGIVVLGACAAVFGYSLDPDG